MGGGGRLGGRAVNVKASPKTLLNNGGGWGGILTPAAGRATQYLPGPRVVDGILPTGRVLLVGGFVLGARHDDFIFCVFFFFFLLLIGIYGNRRRLLCPPPKKPQEKKGSGCDVARRRSRRAEWAVEGEREGGREEGRERTKREEGGR